MKLFHYFNEVDECIFLVPAHIVALNMENGKVELSPGTVATLSEMNVQRLRDFLLAECA